MSAYFIVENILGRDLVQLFFSSGFLFYVVHSLAPIALFLHVSDAKVSLNASALKKKDSVANMYLDTKLVAFAYRIHLNV